MQMNLTRLTLDSCSLAKDDAVEAVISFGLQELEYLNVENTKITGAALIKLLRACNPDKLKDLKIGENFFDLSFYD